jgi:glycosyltransferase involved in cell wall biosynthesis
VPARPTVAVVICAYTEDRWPQIVGAVRSVRGGNVPADELILVADHNERLAAQAEAGLGDVTVVRSRQPPGLSGARNAGIASSRSDIVAFLDDDAEASPAWLERLLAAYDDPQVIAAGGAVRPRWATARPAWWPAEFDWVVGCTYGGAPSEVAPVRNVLGANMSFRRSVFEAIGGFRTGVGRGRGRPLGGEETELCIRAARRFGEGRILHIPEAAVDHHVPADRARLRYLIDRCFAEGLSKAQVARLVGRDRGLASERRHAMRTIPAAMLRDVAGSIRHLDGARLGRASVSALGLATTVAGYAAGSLAGRRRQAAPGSVELEGVATVE